MPSTYLISLSRTELNVLTQATNITEDVFAAVASKYFNSFIDGIYSAIDLYSSQSTDGLRSGDNIILAGHSLGGMEAEVIASRTDFLGRFNIQRVISFGKPKTLADKKDANIARHFLISDDPVVEWVDRILLFVGQRSLGTIELPPTEDRKHSEHSNYPMSPALRDFDALGDPIQIGTAAQYLLLDLEHGSCFRADNPKVMCPPGPPRLGCPNLN